MELPAQASRIRATADYLAALRRDLVELLGPGDHSVIGSCVMRASMAHGRVLLVRGDARHAIYRTGHEEREFDCDLFADLMGHPANTRLERAGALY